MNKRPKMVLFDYGGTLMDEAWDPDPFAGTRALMAYATKNPRGLAPEEIGTFARELHGVVCPPVHAFARELHEWQFTRLLYELLQIEFSIPVGELERVYYAAARVRLTPMPHIKELLAFLAEQNIRTGVVSNIMSSAGELRRRIEAHFSLDQFEFVIASSDYGVGKPDPLIFRLALAKANLPPEDVWFCGDNIRCDVEGAHAAGLRSIWYCDEQEEPPACPQLHIRDWRELIELLKERT